MAAVIVTALGLTALKNPTLWWASTLFTVEVFLLGVTALVAILGRGNSRAACLGFALFGMLYLHVTAPGYGERYIFPPLVFELVCGWIDPNKVFDAHFQDLADNLFSGHVAYSIGTLLFACSGAVTGWLLVRIRPELRNA